VKADVKSLEERITIAVPALLKPKPGGLVPSQENDLLDGTRATYTCIKHKRRVFVLGAGHCGYLFGRNLDPGSRSNATNTVFVSLPRSVVEAGVLGVFRHPSLDLGSPNAHDFVVVEVKQVPRGVEGPFSEWPLPLSRWQKAGVLGGGVFGISTSGNVEGSDLRLLEGVVCSLRRMAKQANPEPSCTAALSVPLDQPLLACISG
jgi:hypothetical protein